MTTFLQVIGLVAIAYFVAPIVVLAVALAISAYQRD